MAEDSVALPSALRGVRRIERVTAVNVTFPGALTVAGGTVPDAVSTRGPLAGMRIAGVLSPAQVASVEALFWATLAVRLAVAVTVAACSWSRLATAACGILMVTVVLVGWMGWPTVTLLGKVAATWALTS